MSDRLVPAALALALGCCGLVRADTPPAGKGADDPRAAGHRLARALTAEADYAGAAIEYRRLALADPDPAHRAGWSWAAAWAHLNAREAERAERALDEAERSADLDAASHLLLRGRIAEARGRRVEAAYFWQSAAGDGEPDARRYAARQLAALRVLQQDPEGARAALALSPEPEEPARSEIDRWARASRRSPALGGWLGLVPGLGYAYSGEYANATRSAILNALFIWIMVRSAEDESWGAFALAAFFEITWYSGSIYGGVDAAHRYNRNLDQQARARILGDADAQPDELVFPAIRLNFRF
jgi:tetratricopeptide (TPR) repeat protein